LAVWIVVPHYARPLPVSNGGSKQYYISVFLAHFTTTKPKGQT